MFFSCRGDFLRRKKKSKHIPHGHSYFGLHSHLQKGSSYYSQEGTQSFPENYRDLKQPQQNLCQPDLLSRHRNVAFYFPCLLYREYDSLFDVNNMLNSFVVLEELVSAAYQNIG